MQTREIKKNPEYYEQNWVLDKLTVDQATIAMVGFIGVVYLAADKFPKYRTQVILIPLTIAVVCVFNNFNIGVTF